MEIQEHSVNLMENGLLAHLQHVNQSAAGQSSLVSFSSVSGLV